MRESSFWSLVKSHVPAGVHAIRIENTAGAGQPDVNMCRDGREVWVELKVAHGERIEIRWSQYVWWRARLSVVGRVRVLVRRDDGRIEMYDPMRVCELVGLGHYTQIKGKKAFTVFLGALIPIATFYKPYDWKQVFQFLLNEV